jgi:predicted adenylyl cyclase CyaB
VLELELKTLIPDGEAARARLLAAGARVVSEGRRTDPRFDPPDRALVARDEVLRTRSLVAPDGTTTASLDWKGPTRDVNGYKGRDEENAAVDGDAVAGILAHLGYVVTQQIDRDVVVYALDGVTVRFEHYPRMDVLAEVEGEPTAIERAIGVLGLPREGFTAARLKEYAADFERRTGLRAALSFADLGPEADGTDG